MKIAFVSVLTAAVLWLASPASRLGELGQKMTSEETEYESLRDELLEMQRYARSVARLGISAVAVLIGASLLNLHGGYKFGICLPSIRNSMAKPIPTASV